MPWQEADGHDQGLRKPCLTPVICQCPEGNSTAPSPPHRWQAGTPQLPETGVPVCFQAQKEPMSWVTLNPPPQDGWDERRWATISSGLPCTTTRASGRRSPPVRGLCSRGEGGMDTACAAVRPGCRAGQCKQLAGPCQGNTCKPQQWHGRDAVSWQGPAAPPTGWRMLGVHRAEANARRFSCSCSLILSASEPAASTA